MTTLDEIIAVTVAESKLKALAARHGGAGAEHIERAFRTLALKHHPDHGGDPVEFRRLKQARDSLLTKLASVEAALRNIPGVEREHEDKLQ